MMWKAVYIMNGNGGIYVMWIFGSDAQCVEKYYFDMSSEMISLKLEFVYLFDTLSLCSKSGKN